MSRWTAKRLGRYGAGGVSLALVASGALSLAIPSSAHASMSPGQGSAYAQSLAVQPHDGSLAVGAIFGEALAGHTNTFARAQSQGLDFGSIGLSLTSGDNCGQPPPLKPSQIPQALQTETGAPGADKGLTQSPTSGTNAQNQGTQSGSFGSTEFVQATSLPYGLAETSYAPVSVGPITISGMDSRAWSGIVNGQREAGATSDIGSISLISGLITLKGLHWESVYPSGGAAQPTSTFSIGQVAIKGVSQSLSRDLSSIQSAINTLLAKLGMQLFLPHSSRQRGVESLSALSLQVQPNAMRDALIAAINNPTEGLQQTIIGGLENGFSPKEPAPVTSAVCQTDTPITVGQITVASIDGGGFLSMSLGGTTASSGEIPSNPFNLNLFTPSFTPGQTLTTPGIPAVAGSTSPLVSAGGGSTGSLGGSNGATGQPAPSTTVGAPSGATQQAAAASYSAGGPLLAIGLIGLGLLGLLAEGDRRVMRRAQHTAIFEE